MFESIVLPVVTFSGLGGSFLYLLVGSYTNENEHKAWSREQWN